MYSAAVFDFDCTLGDSTNGIVLSINYALSKLGYGEKDGKPRTVFYICEKVVSY